MVDLTHIRNQLEAAEHLDSDEAGALLTLELRELVDGYDAAERLREALMPNIMDVEDRPAFHCMVCGRIGDERKEAIQHTDDCELGRALAPAKVEDHR